MQIATQGAEGLRTLKRIAASVVVVTALMVCLGWLVTHSLARQWPLTGEDGVDRFLAAHRDRPLNDVTDWLSTAANTPCASALAVAAFIWVRLAYRRWREALFLAAAVLVELIGFLITTVLIHRPRPAVAELDHSPPTSSFPSGHTAAAVALYGALALLLYLRTRKRYVWALLLIPVAVGFARLYRGMHHPSDVLAGLLLGALALTVAWRALAAPATGLSSHTMGIQVRWTVRVR